MEEVCYVFLLLHHPYVIRREVGANNIICKNNKKKKKKQVIVEKCAIFGIDTKDSSLVDVVYNTLPLITGSSRMKLRMPSPEKVVGPRDANAIVSLLAM